MVIKYLTCEFSDYKIAPGHGLRYAEVNGKTHMFINKKVHRLFTIYSYAVHIYGLLYRCSQGGTQNTYERMSFK